MRAPWALGFDGPVASFHVVAGGVAWLSRPGAAPLELLPGDVALLPHGGPYVLGDDPSTPPVPFEEVVGGCAATGGISCMSWGGGGAPTQLLCGAYRFGGDGPNPVLRGLPSVVHLPALARRGGAVPALVGLLSDEVESPGPGHALAVDRLVDLLVVAVLRAWLADQPRPCPSWFAALHDPATGPALQAVHDDPARRWTVADLAEVAHVGRATLARRFAELVGEPPLTYLTRWRMTVAKRLLEQGDRGLAAIAREVGYDSEYAFAKAFKREVGTSPGRWRAEALRRPASPAPRG